MPDGETNELEALHKEAAVPRRRCGMMQRAAVCCAILVAAAAFLIGCVQNHHFGFRLRAAFRGADVRGAAFHGLLHLEDWFFSAKEGQLIPAGYPYVEVASPPDMPQGRTFPSETLPLDDPWFSEGQLCDTSAARRGDDALIAAMRAHREAYITEFDFQLMQEHGVRYVRLPVGWWVFDSAQLPETESMVTDLCYPDRRFVTVSNGYLTALLQMAVRHGVSFLLDMHAMPCGSADGTYNGVFPKDPIFFLNAKARAKGVEVVRNMVRWYKGLPDDLKAAVHGFTVLNEPGHLIVEPLVPGRPRVTGGNLSVVLSWLSAAVDAYEAELSPSASSAPPLLYMNLIETAFMGGDPDALWQRLASAAGQTLGLANKPWAVLDVHHYFAWGGNGSGIPPENCSTEDDLRRYVRVGMRDWMHALSTAAADSGMANLACSEWSLSLHHRDYVQPCAVPEEAALKIMYDEQVSAFQNANFAQFIWGWRMPQGGVHEKKWSLKWHMTGQS
eukprot:TRINITY_DN43553_c0_g1_i1.p1 TRINITY_DN43553_c0_g1~~TRINITY_DN43553_c0_g1_i1.p1  ORF type:complete len:520 (+),score=145.98 TRINITY_DN43553_c0_g1_i1:58-1560(+)